MSPLESIELLEATNTFPGPFMLKVIGRNEDQFVDRVLVAVREALDLSLDPTHSVRETAGGRHVAVTLEPWFENAETVLHAYQRLRALEGVVLLL